MTEYTPLSLLPLPKLDYTACRCCHSVLISSPLCICGLTLLSCLRHWHLANPILTEPSSVYPPPASEQQNLDGHGASLKWPWSLQWFTPKVALHLHFLPAGFSENIILCSLIFQEQHFWLPGDSMSCFKGRGFFFLAAVPLTSRPRKVGDGFVQLALYTNLLSSYGIVGNTLRTNQILFHLIEEDGTNTDI